MEDVILSLLKVTVKKPALYTCVASNKHSAGANIVKASARVTVAGNVQLYFYLVLGFMKCVKTAKNNQLVILFMPSFLSELLFLTTYCFVLCQLLLVAFLLLQLFWPTLFG